MHNDDSHNLCSHTDGRCILSSHCLFCTFAHADVVFVNLIVMCKFSASPSATSQTTRRDESAILPTNLELLSMGDRSDSKPIPARIYLYHRVCYAHALCVCVWGGGDGGGGEHDLFRLKETETPTKGTQRIKKALCSASSSDIPVCLQFTKHSSSCVQFYIYKLPPLASRLYSVSMTTEYSVICVQLHLMSNSTEASKIF